MNRVPRARRAITLLDFIAAIMIMSVVAGVAVPVVFAATDAYVSAADARRRTEAVAFGAERVVRLLREAPASLTPGELDVVTAQADAIEFGDGKGLSVVGGDLYIDDGTNPAAVICRDVTTFTISYLGADGITDTMATPEDTHRFNVTIEAGGVTLTVAAFVRSRIGNP